MRASDLSFVGKLVEDPDEAGANDLPLLLRVADVLHVTDSPLTNTHS